MPHRGRYDRASDLVFRGMFSLIFLVAGSTISWIKSSCSSVVDRLSIRLFHLRDESLHTCGPGELCR